MRQRVYELELQEQNLSAHFTESHPKLLQIREQLEGAREILTNLKSERVDESKTPNPVKIALYQELQRQETRVAGLNSMIEMKQTQKKELEKQVEKLLDDERELTKMDRDIKTMETKLLSMRDKLEEARVIEGLQSQKISNINVIQPATFVERASSPNKKILVAGFLFLGLFSGIALSFVREGLSPAMRTYEDVETSLGCPVISQVPLFSNSGTSQLNEHYTYSRICQGLISDILFSTSSNQQRGRSVGVLSVEPGAGASTLAANLAMTSGVDCRLKTVLVDADERNRSVSRMFWLNNAPGLFDLVNGTASHSECLQTVNGTPINIIAATGNSRESALAASGSKLSQVLQPYLSEFDLLVVDLPPACQPDQAVAMAQHLDCVLIVIESGKTSRESAKRLIKRLKDSNTNVVGCVLNKSRNHLPGWVRRIVTPKA
jgi:capsular exopolysaccharide synthesis family protein